MREIGRGRRKLPAMAVGLVVASALCGPCDAAMTWSVGGQLLVGKTKKGAPQSSVDVSGMACAPDPGVRRCLIVDDESQGAQVAILHPEGRVEVGQFLRLVTRTFDGKPNGKPVELDAEAVAYADGFFYVIGSHGRARSPDPEDLAEDEIKAAVDKAVFRIKASDIKLSGELVPGWTFVSGSLAPFLSRTGQPLSASFNEPLRPNGLSIEGLAVANRTLFVGFRGPVLDGSAQILSVSETAVFDKGTGRGEVIAIVLGKDQGVAYASGREPPRARGIRDLTSIADGLLVLAGPVNDPDDKKYEKGKPPPPACGDYSIFKVTGPGGPPIRVRDLDGYAGKVEHTTDKPPKPEAILPLDTAGDRVLILFDGAANGGPLEINLRDGFSCAR